MSCIVNMNAIVTAPKNHLAEFNRAQHSGYDRISDKMHVQAQDVLLFCRAAFSYWTNSLGIS